MEIKYVAAAILVIAGVVVLLRSTGKLEESPNPDSNADWHLDDVHGPIR